MKYGLSGDGSGDIAYPEGHWRGSDSSTVAGASPPVGESRIASGGALNGSAVANPAVASDEIPFYLDPNSAGKFSFKEASMLLRQEQDARALGKRTIGEMNAATPTIFASDGLPPLALIDPDKQPLALIGAIGGFVDLAATGLELAGENGARIGSNGRWYGPSFHGNQYVYTHSLSRMGSLLGNATFLLDIGLDAYALTLPESDPDSISTSEFWFNRGVSTVGLANPFFGIPYFLTDTFYPTGMAYPGAPGGVIGALQMQSKLIQENQKILGPDFNLYRDW